MQQRQHLSREIAQCKERIRVTCKSFEFFYMYPPTATIHVARLLYHSQIRKWTRQTREWKRLSGQLTTRWCFPELLYMHWMLHSYSSRPSLQLLTQKRITEASEQGNVFMLRDKLRNTASENKALSLKLKRSPFCMWRDVQQCWRL